MNSLYRTRVLSAALVEIVFLAVFIYLCILFDAERFGNRHKRRVVWTSIAVGLCVGVSCFSFTSTVNLFGDCDHTFEFVFAVLWICYSIIINALFIPLLVFMVKPYEMYVTCRDMYAAMTVHLMLMLGLMNLITQK